MIFAGFFCQYGKGNCWPMAATNVVKQDSYASAVKSWPSSFTFTNLNTGISRQITPSMCASSSMPNFQI